MKNSVLLALLSIITLLVATFYKELKMPQVTRDTTLLLAAIFTVGHCICDTLEKRLRNPVG